MREYKLGVSLLFVWFCFFIGLGSAKTAELKISAKALELKTLEDYGYKDFYVNKFDFYSCKEYTVSFQNDTNYFVFPIMQTAIELEGSPNGTEYLKIYLNNEEVEELRFLEWESNNIVYFPQDKWLKENLVKVCIRTSSNVNKIGFLAKTKIGLFESFYFPKNEGLKLELETKTPFVGRQFKINAVAKNYGSKDVRVTMYYRKNELEKALKELSILKGETSKSGFVPKCKERDKEGKCIIPGELKIKYDAVANKPILMSVLPAVMEFTGPFGQKQYLLSDRPQISVLEPQNDISAEIILTKDKVEKEEIFEVNVVMKNISEKEIENVNVWLIAGEKKVEKFVPLVNSGETKEVIYTTKIESAGKYEIYCEVSYNGEVSECERTFLTVTEKSVEIEAIMTILAGLFGLGLVAYYFYFKK